MKLKQILFIFALAIGLNTIAAPTWVNHINNTVNHTRNTLVANTKELTGNNAELASAIVITGLCATGSYFASNKVTRGSLALLALTPLFSLFVKKPFWAEQFRNIPGIKQLINFTSKAKDTRVLSSFVTCENKECPGICSTCKSRKMVQLLPLAMIPFALGSLLKKLFTSAIAPEDGNTIIEEPEINDETTLPEPLPHSSIDKSESEEVQKEQVIQSVNESQESLQISDVAAENQLGDGYVLPADIITVDETNEERNSIPFEPTDSSDAEESDSDEGDLDAPKNIPYYDYGLEEKEETSVNTNQIDIQTDIETERAAAQNEIVLGNMTTESVECDAVYTSPETQPVLSKQQKKVDTPTPILQEKDSASDYEKGTISIASTDMKEEVANEHRNEETSVGTNQANKNENLIDRTEITDKVAPTSKEPIPSSTTDNFNAGWQAFKNASWGNKWNAAKKAAFGNN